MRARANPMSAPGMGRACATLRMVGVTAIALVAVLAGADAALAVGAAPVGTVIA